LDTISFSNKHTALSSGHEVRVFHGKTRITIILDCPGPEKGGIQNPENGINIEKVTSLESIPLAGGIYIRTNLQTRRMNRDLHGAYVIMVVQTGLFLFILNATLAKKPGSK